MSDKKSQTPRVFIMRHGETEWSRARRLTGSTEIDLNEEGEQQVAAMAKAYAGAGKTIDPNRLGLVVVSPRKRARRTLDLFLPMSDDGNQKPEVVVDDNVAERDHGDYEGLPKEEIQEKRWAMGLDEGTKWNIWRDGCAGGESNQQVTERVDRVISQIRDKQSTYMNGEKPADVLVVSHGSILAVFAARWDGTDATHGRRYFLPPAGIARLK
ncbi:putative phosphoglycerate mutase [Colletotrichum godetiae]|uniref:Phosphoglycerate mutase n=1 Tax=Colletotrichum godetiae TaxID=1209918 RepID=A0AAJ0A6G1_9PEZI|nr:putative phosphoglycerate mutase [Colletotrichum godetiae]KAK1656768.1 putative phosphoglycerate mutase [Colletotrichum godetiae]